MSVKPRSAVTGAHESRWGGERVSAAVRRPRGGAILVTVDASGVVALEKPASLDALLEEITSGSPEIAYTVFEHADGRIAFGELPPDAPASPGERAVEVSGRPVRAERAFAGPPGEGAHALVADFDRFGKTVLQGAGRRAPGCRTCAG